MKTKQIEAHERDPMAGLTHLERELFSALDRLLCQCDRLRLHWQQESDAEKAARAAIAKATGAS